MSSQEFQHVTVLLHEAVDGLNVVSDGVYVDGTFGRGGHSRLILSRLGEKGRLLFSIKTRRRLPLRTNWRLGMAGSA